MTPAETRSAIAHLARRAGFGASPADVAVLARQGYEAAVDHYVGGLAQVDAAADAVPTPTFDSAGYVAGQRGTPEERREARRQVRDERTMLVTWWLQRMAVADHPLREKLTLLWHDHFATSMQKVRLPALMHAQQRTLYELGPGRFDALAAAMVQDAAMLVFLDGRSSVTGRPNENFAREFLELFTLGHHAAGQGAEHDADHTAAYTEADVQDAARAFTGYRLDAVTGAVRFDARRHDDGDKTVLGVSGALGAADIVAAATSHPACAPHVVSRLWSRLARPAGPDDPTVRELAEPFADDLDVTALLRRLFLHEEFLAPATRRGLVKMPIEFVVGTSRALGVEISARATATLMALGQVPFLPPDVSGWTANEGWLSTSSAHARLSFAADVAAVAADVTLGSVAGGRRSSRPTLLAPVLGLDGWDAVTTRTLAAAPGLRTLVTLALIAPEHVLA